MSYLPSLERMRGFMPITRRLFALLLVGALLSSCSMVPGIFSSSQGEFDQGMALFNQGRYQDAADHFQRATELDPNFGRAYLYLGRCYINLRNWGSALTPLRTAYRLVPDETKSEVLGILLDALLSFGLDAFKRGDFTSAIGSFREVLKLQPNSTQARTDLARALIGQGGALLSQGSIGSAISAYTEAVKLAPTNFDGLFGLAKALFRNGDYLKALQTAEDAWRFNSGNRELQSLLQELRRR